MLITSLLIGGIVMMLIIVRALTVTAARADAIIAAQEAHFEQVWREVERGGRG